MSAFTPGAKVTIRGLAARPELNGLTAVVEMSSRKHQGRWVVNIEGQPKAFALKEENLELAPALPSRAVLCAIHHESGTKLLAAKKYHFVEPGPPMMARCKADTPLTATLASLGLTGRVALNLGETA